MKKQIVSMIALLAISMAAMAQSKCADNKHPHMVDLGLPSGTKWACCNLGAKSPNQLGSTYRWGETQVAKGESDLDDLERYSLYNSKTKKFTSIGDNISNTKYDAAHVKLNGKWRMPTKKETEELLANCKFEMKTTASKKIVYTFKGKNGKVISIPVEGGAFDGEEWIPQLTHYWTATNSSDGEAANLWIGPDEMDDENDHHEVLGWSKEIPCYIRPVCK